MPRFSALAACAILVACSGASDPGPMRDALEPRLDAFGEYDRWARRLGLADEAFRSEESLAEAAFAPVRDRDDIVAAWLVREGPDGRSLAYPDDAPPVPRDGWVHVQTRTLGEVEGRHAVLHLDQRARQCLLIRRSAPAPGDAILHVTLAFLDE
jgi:hypothetical protein